MAVISKLNVVSVKKPCFLFYKNHVYFYECGQRSSRIWTKRASLDSSYTYQLFVIFVKNLFNIVLAKFGI